jgi:hypothetical protein
MNLVLIDDIGTLWDGASTRLRQAFDAPFTADDFSSYVVKNMGFIAINVYGRSCEIRARPRLLGEKTLTSLGHWLSARSFDRVITAHFDTDWHYRMHQSRSIALGMLQDCVSKTQWPQPGDYLTRPLKQAELPRTTPLHRVLHSLIENWPMLSQAVHQDGLKNIIKQSLQGRYTLVDAAPGARDLTFREIGHGFVSYTDDWVTRSSGLPVEQLEDAAYGRWAANGYRAALVSGVPTVCDVDAIMNTPKLGRARVRYKRVLLPARNVAGGAWLLTSSIIDPTIDLRADHLKKSA